MKERKKNMFNLTYYKLQAKKAAWFCVMLGTAIFTVVKAAAIPMYVKGAAIGMTALHSFMLMPNAGLLLLQFALFVYSSTSPLFQSIAAGFFGLFIFRFINNRIMTDDCRVKHEMGEAENKEIAILNKLEKKTGLRVIERYVLDVDEKIFSPNASAGSNLLSNDIRVTSNMLKAPFTKEEKKAVFAHEFAHIKNRDPFVLVASHQMYWCTALAALSSFDLPLALTLLVANHVAFYQIAQQGELLADQFAAQHANPQDLISALDKMKAQIKFIEENRPYSLRNLVRAIKHSIDEKIGCVSHPTLTERTAYLIEYDNEKRRAPAANR